MPDVSLCSCGLARHVLPGGILECQHCDGPECCRSNPAHCDQCRTYAKTLTARR